MKAASLQKAIQKLGGTAEIKTVPTTYGEKRELVGELNGHDVHMIISNYSDGQDFFTVRAITKRGEYDPGSDYNPGGYTFCNRIKDLNWAAKLTN